MRRILTCVLLLSSQALACLPPHPDLLAARDGLEKTQIGRVYCPTNLPSEAMCTAYRAKPAQVAEWMALTLGTNTARQRNEWRVEPFFFTGESAIVRARGTGSLVAKLDHETGYESLMGMLTTAIEQGRKVQGQAATCQSLGLGDNNLVGFEKCRVDWQKASLPLPGHPLEPLIRFTLSRVADDTVRVKVPLKFFIEPRPLSPCVTPDISNDN